MAAKTARLRPRKRFGQHFLSDPAAVRRIVAALGPRDGPPVVEIGPGRGALTASLLQTFGRLLAIEIDRDLAAHLRQRFPAASLTVLEADVLDVPLQSLAAGPVRLVGNLPYNVSKPVADKIVRERTRVAGAVLMFQREVAERLTAEPGMRAFGPLTVLVGEAFSVERLFDLGARAFRPVPEVSSTVTRWTPRPGAFSSVSEDALRAALRAGFTHRRRTLRNNVPPDLLELAGIDGGLRAEALPPAAWRRLARVWPR
jgi:16S rRNA (adenine1518-N6/adenine1519-N6)-dimethyltransferase